MIRSALISLVCFSLLLLLTLPVLAQTPPNPFALGGIEGAGGRPGSGLAAFILAKQAEFTRSMTIAARAIKTDWAALWSLLGLSLAYGIFHAAGPGHGKAIIASYVVANEAALKRGALIATLAALLQGIMAVAVVAIIALVLGGTSRSMTNAINWIETLSYATIAAFGLLLLLRKLKSLWTMLRPETASLDPSCDHFHMPGAEDVMRWSLRDGAAAVFAAGLRPCSGAILILVFTLAQGIFWAGIAAVAAMSLGTAITTGGIAALAVYAKGLAVRLASGRGNLAAVLLRSLEVLAALAVMLLGLALLAGHWASLGGA